MSLSLVGELGAKLNVVVTELSMQFLVAHKVLVIILEAKPSEVPFVIEWSGSNNKVAVFDYKDFYGKHIVSNTI